MQAEPDYMTGKVMRMYALIKELRSESDARTRWNIADELIAVLDDVEDSLKRRR